MTRTPEQLELALKRLRLMREERVRTATPVEGNLVPLLTASAECVALDAAMDALWEQLREAMS
jgi:hypothetical protein